jgi:hypothetical protein
MKVNALQETNTELFLFVIEAIHPIFCIAVAWLVYTEYII